MSVIDGDTIRVKVHGVTERVQVIGIDTPELHADECYAPQAANRMQALVQSGKVRLARDPTQADRDHHGRLLRHVTLSDGRQVARVLIAGGFGEEFTDGKPYAGQSSYRSAERAARDAGRGVWSSGCTAPARGTASGSCRIKGNVTGDGDRIYHVPGQRSYEVTRITVGTGERWFCTERQARDAGWRASRG
ncbi:MAG TPA: thermonuclease family protein [Ornithinibacter sp.]|nr:thermonuclease family protein [Ornithinibacter sp.]